MSLEGKFFFIQSRLNGLVLDVAGWSSDPGCKVHTYTIGDNQANQIWYEDRITGTIRSKHNNMCLDVSDESCLCLNPYDPDNPGQKLMVAGDRIQLRDSPNKVLDIAGCNCDEGADICCWDHDGSKKHQHWHFQYLPVEYFTIKSNMNEKAIDISGSNESEGATVFMYECHGNDNQQWYEGRDGLIRSKLNGFVFDSADGEIAMQPYNPGSESQGFMYSEGKIANINDPEQVLDIAGWNSDDRAPIVQYEFKSQPNQLWTIEYV